jgi:multiple sugar transport system ATP-binding protein
MDEPLSNLDAKLRVQMRAEIARIQRELGVTTVYVTHDQVEAMTMGDRVAVLKAGILQQVDTPQNLYDYPANLFVGAFIGSPSMNLYEGTLTASDGGATLKLGSQTLALPASVIDKRPALRDHLGQKLTVGIRPEHMEDATLVPDHPQDQRIKTDVELVEALGSELMVHATVDARPVESGDPDAVEEAVAEGETPLVARFSARSRVSRGETVEVAVETDEIYFFDADSGLAIR